MMRSTKVRLIDENGNEIKIDIFIDYKPEDVTSITFYENWSYDINNETGEIIPIQKQVIGYTLNVASRNPETFEIQGFESLIYIPCAKEAHRNKMIILKENICTSTRINNSWRQFNRGEEYQVYNWYNNNLNADFRFHFCQLLINLSENPETFLAHSKVKGIYDTDNGYNIDKDGFPYTKELSSDTTIFCDSTVISKSGFFSSRHLLDSDGNGVLDENGNVLIQNYFEPFSSYDICALGFVEDWLFDEKTLSIQKTVKGLMPMVYERNVESLEIEGLKNIFCIKY